MLIVELANVGVCLCVLKTLFRSPTQRSWSLRQDVKTKKIIKKINGSLCGINHS